MNGNFEVGPALRNVIKVDELLQNVMQTWQTGKWPLLVKFRHLMEVGLVSQVYI